MADAQKTAVMTPRDQLAAAALQALGTWVPSSGGAALDTAAACAARAKVAYLQADAMLAARKVGA